VISSLREIYLSLEGEFSETNPKVVFRDHPLAIVLSQDCDLEQDYSTRNRTRPAIGISDLNNLLSSIIFCEVIKASDLRDTGPDMDSKTWKRVKFNKDERYHFLAEVPASADLQGEGLPCLALDFKKYFTIPTDVVYWQVGLGAKRRCFLVPPYAGHLSARFFSYQSRIALPLDHHRYHVDAPAVD
jgi:hypothetical protein